MQAITPFLWFDTGAEAAVEFWLVPRRLIELLDSPDAGVRSRDPCHAADDQAGAGCIGGG